MAYGAVGIKYRHVLFPNQKWKHIYLPLKSMRRGLMLSDNRRQSDANQGHVLQDEKRLTDRSSSNTEPAADEKDGGHGSSDVTASCVPSSVREIRHRLRTLHSLSSEVSFERRRLGHGAVGTDLIQNGLEDEVVPESGSDLQTDDTSEVTSEEIRRKFMFLSKPRRDRSDRVIQTVYGYVRLDTHPEKEEKPETESDNKHVHEGLVMGKTDIKDASKFSEKSEGRSRHKLSHHEGLAEKTNTKDDGPTTLHKAERVPHALNDNLFDEQYFADYTDDGLKMGSVVNNIASTRAASDADIRRETSEPSNKSSMKETLSDVDFIDQQYFGQSSVPTEGRSPNRMERDHSNFTSEQHLKKSQQVDGHAKLSELNGQVITPKMQKEEEVLYKGSQTGTKTDVKGTQNKDSDVFVEVKTKQEQRIENRVKPNLENPQTPYDLAMKIRKEKRTSSTATETILPRDSKWAGEVDSKGFRILKNQVLDIQNMPRDVVVNILKNSILYEDDGLLAIDKPYGLPSHGGPGVHHSVGQLLEDLANRCHLKDNLYLIHRLDKETTGVMLFAKTGRTQSIIHDMFVKQKVIKKYWLITKGIPDPPEGVIDIPMAEGTVGDKKRMTLRPRYPKEYKLLVKTSHRQHCFEAVTNYKVLDSNNQTALVECQPESGVKHQIRCHMAFALNTPILGDHKYSHFSKLAPQRLHPETLQRLGIRQAKVRHVPMHLHARLIVLPEYLNGRNLFITANLPRHFRQNMKWLKLSPP